MPRGPDQIGEHRPALAAAEQDSPLGRPDRLCGKRWREQAKILRREVQVIWLILKDSRTPWSARMVNACAVGYLFSPIQLIPSFIPVIGFLDDFLVLTAAFKLTHRLVPEAVIRDCRERAAAEAVPEQEIRLLARPLSAAVAGAWLLVTIAATLWLYRH